MKTNVQIAATLLVHAVDGKKHEITFRGRLCLPVAFKIEPGAPARPRCPTLQNLVDILGAGTMKKRDLVSAIMKVAGRKSYAYKLVNRAISGGVIRTNADGLEITGKIRPSHSDGGGYAG